VERILILRIFMDTNVLFQYSLITFFNTKYPDYIFIKQPGSREGEFEIVSTKNSTNKSCTTLKMNFQNNELSIHLLSICHISGTDIMQTIIEFCKIQHINMKLIDISSIDFNFTDGSRNYIDLKKIKILQTGTSWYGTLGFKNDFLTDHQYSIHHFIHSNLTKIYAELLPGGNDDAKYLQQLKNEHSAFIHAFPEEFSINMDEPICDMFIRIQQILKSLCNSECKKNGLLNDKYIDIVQLCTDYVEKTCQLLIASFLLYSKMQLNKRAVTAIDNKLTTLDFKIDMSEHMNPYKIGKKVNLTNLADSKFNGIPVTIVSNVNQGRIKVKLPDSSLRSVKVNNIKGGKTRKRVKKTWRN